MLAQGVGPSPSATAGMTDGSGGVGSSDMQLDDAEVALACLTRAVFRHHVADLISEDDAQADLLFSAH